MKRIGYSLIGAGCLWFVTLAALIKNPLQDRWSGFSEDEAMAEMTGHWDQFTTITVLILLLAFPAAGWILAGTSIPREGPAHRLIMAFTAGIAGLFAAFSLMIGIFLLRDWMWPLPHLPEKD